MFICEPCAKRMALPGKRLDDMRGHCAACNQRAGNLVSVAHQPLQGPIERQACHGHYFDDHSPKCEWTLSELTEFCWLEV